MVSLLNIGAAVRTRRTDMGLTQATLARLSGLSRATVNQIETAKIKDLSLVRVGKLLHVLGLSMTVSQVRSRQPVRKHTPTSALELAARSASVSYRTPLPAAKLRTALVQGHIASQFQPHLGTLLEEASTTLLASVVEQLHAEEGLERHQVWATMHALAQAFKTSRPLWQ